MSSTPPNTPDQTFLQQQQSQYGSEIPDDLVQQLQGSGIPLTSQGAEFYVDELDAGNGGAFKGFHLPAGDPQHDFFQLMSWAEQWAANTGWKYFPTPVQLQWGVENGVIAQGQDAALRWFAGMMPKEAQQKMPWAWTGMSQSGYQKKVESYQEVMDQLAGEGSYSNQGLVDQALREGWSTEKLRTHLLQDQGFTGRFQYTKYGYDYQTWQQHKVSERNNAIQRFGVNPGENEYLQMITNPLQSVSASGAAVRQDPQSQQHQSYQSTIR